MDEEKIHACTEQALKSVVDAYKIESSELRNDRYPSEAMMGVEAKIGIDVFEACMQSDLPAKKPRSQQRQ